MLTAPPASRCGDAEVVSAPPPPPSEYSPAVQADEVVTLGVPALEVKANDGVAAPAAGLPLADDETVFDGRDVLGAAGEEAAATVAAAVAAAICCIKFRLLLARLMPTDAAPRLTLTGAAAAAAFPGTDGTPTDPAGNPCAKPYTIKGIEAKRRQRRRRETGRVQGGHLSLGACTRHAGQDTVVVTVAISSPTTKPTRLLQNLLSLSSSLLRQIFR